MGRHRSYLFIADHAPNLPSGQLAVQSNNPAAAHKQKKKIVFSKYSWSWNIGVFFFETNIGVFGKNFTNKYLKIFHKPE